MIILTSFLHTVNIRVLEMLIFQGLHGDLVVFTNNLQLFCCILYTNNFVFCCYLPTMYFNKNKIRPATVSEANPASDRLGYIIMHFSYCIYTRLPSRGKSNGWRYNHPATCNLYTLSLSKKKQLMDGWLVDYPATCTRSIEAIFISSRNAS